MDESLTDYSTFTCKMYRGLNLHFQIYVRFLLATDNLRHKIEIIYVWGRFPHNIKCYSSNHLHVVTEAVYLHGQTSLFLDERDASS